MPPLCIRQAGDSEGTFFLRRNIISVVISALNNLFSSYWFSDYCDIRNSKLMVSGRAHFPATFSVDFAGVAFALRKSANFRWRFLGWPPLPPAIFQQDFGRPVGTSGSASNPTIPIYGFMGIAHIITRRICIPSHLDTLERHLTDSAKQRTYSQTKHMLHHRHIRFGHVCWNLRNEKTLDKGEGEVGSNFWLQGISLFLF